jgi:hypothetical protein
MEQWGYGPDKQWRFEARIAIYAADVADQIEKHADWGSEQLSVHQLQLNPLTEVMEIYADAKTLARLRDRAAELGTVDETSTEYLERIETALLQRVTEVLQYRRTLDAHAAPANPPADPGRLHPMRSTQSLPTISPAASPGPTAAPTAPNKPPIGYAPCSATSQQTRTCDDTTLFTMTTASRLT